jgi:hypothetical protein
MSKQQPINSGQPPDIQDLSRQEREFEQDLSALIPLKPRFDAQQIWVTAIARKEHRRVWFWRGVSGALAASLLVTLWARNPASPPPSHEQYSRQSKTPSIAPAHAIETSVIPDSPVDLPPAASSDSYFLMRQRVLQAGLGPVPHDIRGPELGIAHGSIVPVELDRAVDFQGNPLVHFFNLLGKGVQL